MKEENTPESRIRIIHSSETLLIISKPAGISFHLESEGKDEGILQIVRRQQNEIAEAGNNPESNSRIYPVHRLDTMTSGILMFARDKKTANLLGNAFRFGRVEKVYAAISAEKPNKVMGSVIGDMAKSRDGSWKLLRSTTNPAITRFISFPYQSNSKSLRLFLLYPETGKTHQLRVALKSIGSPVLGDGRYGGYSVSRTVDRGYLHAAAIRFELEGKQYSFTDPPSSGREFESDGFKGVWKKVGNPFHIKWPGHGKDSKKAARTNSEKGPRRTEKRHGQDTGSEAPAKRRNKAKRKQTRWR